MAVGVKAFARGHLRALPAASSSPASAPPRPRLEDDAIIQGVQRGDARVAQELYERVSGVIDRTLWRIFGRREPDHEDLVQATFEQIVLTLTRRRFAGACSLTTWASSIASHVGLNALRSRRRERRVFEAQGPDDGRRPEPHGPADLEREASARQELERLREHLGAMNPAKARVVFLHDVLGLELAEIAVLETSSVSAVQSRLVRGRAELTARLERARLEDEVAQRHRPSSTRRGS